MIRLPDTLILLALLIPGPAQGQGLFDWPLRASPQPEAILTGAGTVLWNPGSMVQEVGTSQEALILHVNGPDVTGVRGVALAGTFDLPRGLRGGAAFSHLGISDIVRTTDSPSPEPGGIQVSEEVAVLGLGFAPGPRTGLGAALRFRRGSAAGESRTWSQFEVGIHHRSPLPLSPRFGLVIRGAAGEWQALLGTEAVLASWASSRVPVRMGYGVHIGQQLDSPEHRISLRTSWMDLFHLGMGLSYQGEGNGWSPLWMAGADMGRYSLSVLRESLANNFGAVHFFQASVRFP